MRRISVIDALSDALQRTMAILFSPFDAGQWLVVGFAAWLAALGETGIPTAAFQLPLDKMVSHPESAEQTAGFARELLPALFAIGAVVVVLVVLAATAMGIAILWLSSRGRFMFLHDVAADTAEIARSWSRFARHGNSLFLWHLVFGLAVLAVLLTIVLAGVLLAIPSAMAGRLLPVTIAGIACGVMTLVAVGLASACIELFLKDFVAPLMYALDANAPTAWQAFIVLLRAHPGPFAAYVLVRALLALIAAVVIGGVLFLTCCCCCLGFLLSIPYVSAVLLLPVSVFYRCFSLEFLARFDPAYNCFDLSRRYAAPTPPPLPQFI